MIDCHIAGKYCSNSNYHLCISMASCNIVHAFLSLASESHPWTLSCIFCNLAEYFVAILLNCKLCSCTFLAWTKGPNKQHFIRSLWLNGRKMADGRPLYCTLLVFIRSLWFHTLKFHSFHKTGNMLQIYLAWNMPNHLAILKSSSIWIKQIPAYPLFHEKEPPQ